MWKRKGIVVVGGGGRISCRKRSRESCHASRYANEERSCTIVPEILQLGAELEASTFELRNCGSGAVLRSFQSFAQTSGLFLGLSFLQIEAGRLFIS